MVWALQSGLGGWQIANMVIGGAVLLAFGALARMLTNKADKPDVADLKTSLEAKADRVELNRVESESKARSDKLETKVDAAMLVVNQGITRAELTEKMTAASGRADDKTQRIIADIVQLNTDTKATAKSAADTDKRLDDLPGRVRTLEDSSNKRQRE